MMHFQANKRIFFFVIMKTFGIYIYSKYEDLDYVLEILKLTCIQKIVIYNYKLCVIR